MSEKTKEITIEIRRPATIAEVEKKIKEKLSSERTDLFEKFDRVVIQVQHYGPPNGPATGGKPRAK